MPSSETALPSWVPDHFAGSEPEPRSLWGGSVTSVGLVATLWFMASAVLDWHNNPLNTEVKIVNALGETWPFQITCDNLLGCSVVTQYSDAKCAEAAGAASVDLVDGEETTVKLCGSTEWSDGVTVSVALGALTGLGSSPVSFRTGAIDSQPATGRTVALPFVPISLPGAAEKTNAIEFGLTAAEDQEGVTTGHWSAGTPYRSAATCTSQSDAAAPGGLLNANAGGSVVGELGRVCYMLKLQPTVTTMTTRAPFTLMHVLETWGAAYSFVFEMLGYALFGLGGVVAGTGAMKKRTASVEVGTTAAEKRTHVGL
jgi:hypothetical protein